MEDIRIAIVGHGFMGHEHEKMLSDFPGIKLIGISDIDPEQLEDVRPGLKRYASNDELIHDPDVDVVLVVCNNTSHHDVVIQAAEAGKQLLREAEERAAEAAVEIAKDAGRESDQLRGKARSRMDEAAKFIVGRVVKS